MAPLLRPYQTEFVNNIRELLFRALRIIACAATGSGKTKTFIAISRMAIEKRKTVLILSEATKIFNQIAEELGNATEITSKIKHIEVQTGSIFVAMAQTLAKRPKIIAQFKALGKDLLVITDEAHVGTPSTLLLQLMEAYHIGFTATPDFRVAKHLPKLYNDIVVGPQPQWLVENNFLAPYYHFERKVANLAGLKKGSNGEFTEQSQESVFEKTEVFEGIIEDIKKFPFKKAMIFVASIKQCEDLSCKMRYYGYKVAVVHSKNPDSNFELFQFQNLMSGIDICISVASLTKGFDMPAIDLLMLNRATLSLPLYLQMCGRGSRPCTYSGKTRFTVVDYGGNASRHNTWNYEHPWETMWKGKVKVSEGIAPVKSCPICECICHASVPVCPNCFHIFEKKKLTPKETELVEVTTKYNLLRGRKISTLTPEELSFYAKSTNRKAYAIRVAKSKNDFNFLREFSFKMGYKESFVYAQHTDEKIDFQDIIIK